MEWTDEEVDLAIRLYKEGETRRVIAQHVNKTRNAVIGKLHRLGYSEAQPKPTELVGNIPFAPPPKNCQWPIGHPGEKGFHFCGETVIRAGRPYCEHHHAVAYRQPKQAEDDAAEGKAA